MACGEDHQCTLVCICFVCFDRACCTGPAKFIFQTKDQEEEAIAARMSVVSGMLADKSPQEPDRAPVEAVSRSATDKERAKPKITRSTSDHAILGSKIRVSIDDSQMIPVSELVHIHACTA